MSRNSSEEIEDGKPVKEARGSSQRLLLLVLLLLVAAFGYLYFFTGLIKPREEARKAAPVQASPVKLPLPLRPEQGGEKQAPAAKQAERQPVQAKTEKPAAAPAPAPAKPAAAPDVKPAAAPVHMQAAKPPPAPAAAAKAPPAPAKVAAAASGGGKKVSEPAKAVRKTAQPAEKKGAYTLLVGEIAGGQDMERVRAKLKKLGITPVRTKTSMKLELMHRLFLGEFDSHYAADMELQKLQQKTGSAFVLEENGKYMVYAGSYLHETGAAAEQQRLAGKGVKVVRKTAKVTIPVTKVTAGAFSRKADAQKAITRLKKQEIIAAVIKAGS